MNQKRIIRFDYGYTKTAEPEDQCSREPEFTALFQRAAQITAHKKDQASSDAAQKCVQGAFDLDSLYEAAKELGYLSGNNPFKNPQRFADNLMPLPATSPGVSTQKAKNTRSHSFKKN